MPSGWRTPGLGSEPHWQPAGGRDGMLARPGLADVLVGVPTICIAWSPLPAEARARIWGGAEGSCMAMFCSTCCTCIAGRHGG